MTTATDLLAELGFRDSPTYAAVLARVREQYARAVARPCPFGNCAVDIDPLDNTIISGVGPALCGCDNLPGWRATRWDGLPKPGWSAKPVGRHGGRIAASRRKHADLARFQREMTR